MSKLEEFITKVLVEIWKDEKIIYWYDRYFKNECIEILPRLFKDLKGPKEINIITTPIAIQDNTLALFEKNRSQLKDRKIVVNFRVLSDEKLAKRYHDRWILTKNIGFKIESLNSIIANQEVDFIRLGRAQLQKRYHDLRFLWQKSLDVRNSFKKIQQEIAELAWKKSVKKVIYATLGESIENIIKKMINNDISQLPVKNERGEIIGAITEQILTQILVAGEKNIKDALRKKDIAPPFPILEEKDFDEFIKIANLLYYYPAVLLKKDGKISIMTRADILNYWKTKKV